MSQEQQEKSLFMFVVVVGYLMSFGAGWDGGTRYFVPRLPLGIMIRVIYLTLGIFEAELPRPLA